MIPDTNKKNIEFFKRELPHLLNDVAYQGKFVVIHDAKISNVYDSFESALMFAVSKFPPNEFIIQQVIDENNRINFIRSAVA